MDDKPFALTPAAKIIRDDKGRRTPAPMYFEEQSCTNLETALALARGASKKPADAVFAMAFGYQGTGKSTFSKSLGWRLCRPPHSFSHVLVVDCLRMSRMMPKDAQKYLDEMWDIIFDKNKKHPKILALFDEIDSISRDRDSIFVQEHPSTIFMTYWTMDLFRHLERVERRMFLVGITNHVQMCDPGVREFLGYPLYFEPPGLETLLHILEINEVPQPRETAAAYIDACSDAQPLHRTIAKALRSVKRDVAEWQNLSPSELAKYLLVSSRPEPKSNVRQYEIDNAYDIRRAGIAKELFSGKTPQGGGDV